MSALERALSFAERVDLTREPEMLSDLALAHCTLGAQAKAHALAERALELAVKRGLLGVEVLALRALARLHLADGAAASLTEARRLLDRAESKAEEIGYRLIGPRLHKLRAELAKRQGDSAAAEGALREAQRLYQEMGAPLQVERLAKELRFVTCPASGHENRPGAKFCEGCGTAALAARDWKRFAALFAPEFRHSDRTPMAQLDSDREQWLTSFVRSSR